MNIETLTDQAFELFKSHKYKELVAILSDNVLAEHRSSALITLRTVAQKILDLRKEVVRESVESFENIEHRMEEVGVIDGVTFINDSKATNVNSTWYALESIETPIVLILGGTDKGNEYDELVELIQTKVRAIVCLGVDNTKIYESFGRRIETIVEANSAEQAVDYSFALSMPGDTVLLSPACASFDRFQNYEDRGRQFKEAVQNLSRMDRTKQVLECSLYLSTDNEFEAHFIFDSFMEVANTFGFFLYSEEPPIYGSWFKKFRLRAINIWESKSTQDRIKQLEYALNLHGVKRAQSETDANYINAISNLMEASKDEQEMVLHIGALLYIKLVNAEDKSTVIVKTLTTDQLVMIERNPELAANPKTLLKMLSESADQGEH